MKDYFRQLVIVRDMVLNRLHGDKRALLLPKAVAVLNVLLHSHHCFIGSTTVLTRTASHFEHKLHHISAAATNKLFLSQR